MLAEVYKHNHSNPPSITRLDLYTKFVKLKFDMYCTEKKKEDLTNTGVILDNQILYPLYLEKHKKFSICFLLKELENTREKSGHENQYFEIFEPLIPDLIEQFLRPKILVKIFEKEEIKYISTCLENDKTGIIDCTNNKPRFIHRTFAEYFASLYFIENLENENIHSVLIEHIFLEKEYFIVREFIESNI